MIFSDFSDIFVKNCEKWTKIIFCEFFRKNCQFLWERSAKKWKILKNWKKFWKIWKNIWKTGDKPSKSNMIPKKEHIFTHIFPEKNSLKSGKIHHTKNEIFLRIYGYKVFTRKAEKYENLCTYIPLFIHRKK